MPSRLRNSPTSFCVPIAMTRTDGSHTSASRIRSDTGSTESDTSMTSWRGERSYCCSSRIASSQVPNCSWVRVIDSSCVTRRITSSLPESATTATRSAAPADAARRVC